MTNDIERAARALLEAMDRSKAPTDFVTATKKDALRSALAHAARGEGECLDRCGGVHFLKSDADGPVCATCGWRPTTSMEVEPVERELARHVYLAQGFHAEAGDFDVFYAGWIAATRVADASRPTPPPAEGVEAKRRAALDAPTAGGGEMTCPMCQRGQPCAASPDPRRGEDGAAIDAQDPMAEYVAASLAWWLDESPEAERMEGETWGRFWRAYYALPVSVRMGAR